MSGLSPTTGGALTETARARLAPGVVLRQDKTRGIWTLQGPERVLVLDDVALAVVRAGVHPPGRTLGEAIDALAAEFDAPRDDLAADVLELTADMRNRGFVVAAE